MTKRPPTIQLGVAAILFLAVPAFTQARYRHKGPAVLNDLKYTPGAVRTTDLKQLCPHAETKEVRNVTAAEKKAACRKYGVTHCSGKRYEIDHLVSLELGGSNALSNLWPKPEPQAREMKDKVEDWSHAQVCSGKIPLTAAQHWISTNWYALWELMKKGAGK